MTRKRFSFDIETRCGLGVAVHAAMCADATLTPDQAISIARHEAMEAKDQLMAYATAAGIDSAQIITATEVVDHEPGDVYYEEAGIIDGLRIMALDIGLRPGVSVILGAGLKMAEQMARDFDVRAPRAVRTRDWEQRLKKRRRR